MMMMMGLGLSVDECASDEWLMVGLIASTSGIVFAPSKSVMLLFSSNTNNLYAQKNGKENKHLSE